MHDIGATSDLGRVNSESPHDRSEIRDELLDLRGVVRLEPNQIRWILDWARHASYRGIEAVIVCDLDSIRLALSTLRVSEVATICSSEEYETVCGAGVQANPVEMADPEAKKENRRTLELFRCLMFAAGLAMLLAVSGCKVGTFIGTRPISGSTDVAVRAKER